GGAVQEACAMPVGGKPRTYELWIHPRPPARRYQSWLHVSSAPDWKSATGGSSLRRYQPSKSSRVPAASCATAAKSLPGPDLTGAAGVAATTATKVPGGNGVDVGIGVGCAVGTADGVGAVAAGSGVVDGTGNGGTPPRLCDVAPHAPRSAPRTRPAGTTLRSPRRPIPRRACRRWPA